METSALFTFPPDEDDEKNVYATLLLPRLSNPLQLPR